MPCALENVRKRSTRGSSGSIAGQRAGGCEVGVRLVQAQQHVGRQRAGERLDRRRVPPAAHRIVGIRQEHEPRPLRAGEREQRVEVLAVVAVGRRDEPAAVARDVERERRIRAERADDRHARLDVQARDDAEERVDALTDDHVRRRHAVACRDRLLEVVVLGVAVLPAVGRCRVHRRDRARRGAEGALVGTEPRAERTSSRALQRLRADERHAGGQARRRSRSAARSSRKRASRVHWRASIPIGRGQRKPRAPGARVLPAAAAAGAAAGAPITTAL